MGLPVLTAIANIGSQSGEAIDAARKEKLERAEKIHQMDVNDAYLQLAKQADERQQQEQEFRRKAGDLIEFKDGRIWSVSQGKFIDLQRPDPMTSLKSFVDTLPPDIAKAAQSRAETFLKINPNDPKGAITEVMRYADEAQKEARQNVEKKAEQDTRHKEHEEDIQESEKFRKQQSSDQRAFQKQMIDWRLQDRQKYMTPQERQMYDSIRIAEPMVDRLTKFIEDNKLQDQNSYIFGNHSALSQHMRFYGYKKGVEPEKVSSQLIKDAAALKVMGARPWMSMGRGKYLYEDIVQHLPQPTDTPGQLYSKVTWLRDNVLEDAKSSLAGYVQPGGAQSQDQSDPLNVLK